jgi:hypothetical protein
MRQGDEIVEVVRVGMQEGQHLHREVRVLPVEIQVVAACAAFT